MFELKKDLVLKSKVRVGKYLGVPSGSKGHGGGAGEQIESFYEALGEGLLSLENSVPAGSLSFQVEWLQLGVGFLHRVHSNAFVLVEQLWLPNVSVRSIRAPEPGEILNEYLDVSTSLLDTCSNLKEGMNQVETYHLGLELALEKLTSASESLHLQNSLELGSDVGNSMLVLNPLNDAAQELERLESSKNIQSSYLWVGLLSHHGPRTVNNGLARMTSSSVYRTVRVHPVAELPGKKKRSAVSLLLDDVQVVTSFVSNFLLWVLTGQAGEDYFSSHVEALEPSSKLQRATSWPSFMFRLKEKVTSEQCFHDLESSNGQMKLQDVKNFHRSLTSLRAELKAGLREGKLAPDTAFSDRMKNLLELEKMKLGELSGSLARISAQLNDMFAEIMERRKKVLDSFEQSLYPQASV